eukprot:6043427-Pyramimonas_sp.AAC.4
MPRTRQETYAQRRTRMNAPSRPVRVHHVQTMEDGIRLAVHEWPGDKASTSLPTVVFLHGTGFHARCWDRIIVDLPRSIRCLSIDQSGHGQSDKPDPGGLPYDWNVLGDRVLSLLRTLNVRGALGVGHSSGGHSICHVAVRTYFHAVEPFSTNCLQSIAVSYQKPYSKLKSGGKRERTVLGVCTL